MRQTELSLSREDRKIANAVRAKGACSARQVNRAHILLSLDRLVPEAQIIAVLELDEPRCGAPELLTAMAV